MYMYFSNLFTELLLVAVAACLLLLLLLFLLQLKLTLLCLALNHHACEVVITAPDILESDASRSALLAKVSFPSKSAHTPSPARQPRQLPIPSAR